MQVESKEFSLLVSTTYLLVSGTMAGTRTPGSTLLSLEAKWLISWQLRRSNTALAQFVFQDAAHRILMHMFFMCSTFLGRRHRLQEAHPVVFQGSGVPRLPAPVS